MAEAKKEKKPKIGPIRLTLIMASIGLVLLIWGMVSRSEKNPSQAVRELQTSHYSETLTLTNGGDWVGTGIPPGWRMTDSVLTPGVTALDYWFDKDPKQIHLDQSGHHEYGTHFQYKAYRISSGQVPRRVEVLCQFERER